MRGIKLEKLNKVPAFLKKPLADIKLKFEEIEVIPGDWIEITQTPSCLHLQLKQLPPVIPIPKSKGSGTGTDPTPITNVEIISVNFTLFANYLYVGPIVNGYFKITGITFTGSDGLTFPYPKNVNDSYGINPAKFLGTVCVSIVPKGNYPVVQAVLNWLALIASNAMNCFNRDIANGVVYTNAASATITSFVLSGKQYTYTVSGKITTPIVPSPGNNFLSPTGNNSSLINYNGGLVQINGVNNPGTLIPNGSVQQIGNNPTNPNPILPGTYGSGSSGTKKIIQPPTPAPTLIVPNPPTPDPIVIYVPDPVYINQTITISYSYSGSGSTMTIGGQTVSVGSNLNISLSLSVAPIVGQQLYCKYGPTVWDTSSAVAAAGVPTPSFKWLGVDYPLITGPRGGVFMISGYGLNNSGGYGQELYRIGTAPLGIYNGGTIGTVSQGNTVAGGSANYFSISGQYLHYWNNANPIAYYTEALVGFDRSVLSPPTLTGGDWPPSIGFSLGLAGENQYLFRNTLSGYTTTTAQSYTGIVTLSALPVQAGSGSLTVTITSASPL